MRHHNFLSPLCLGLEPVQALTTFHFLITAPCSDVCEAAFLDCVAGEGAVTGNLIKRKKILKYMYIMAFPVVEFSGQGYKIRNVLG